MKNSADLLYQIRGLARSVVAFVFFYQGLIPKLLLSQTNLLSEPPLLNHAWILYLNGCIDIGLAVWLIIAFADKKPLWISGGFLLLSLFGSICFSPMSLGTSLNIITFTVTLYALMLIDLYILNFQDASIQQRKVGQYIRVTRDKMLYEFITRLELGDLPHLAHTLAQTRVKRHLKNRQKTKGQPDNTTRSRSNEPPPKE